jgi:hypothetical protein
MPIVEATVEIAVIVCGDQKFVVWMVKKSATPIRPMAGASSGTLRRDSRTDLGAGLCGCVACETDERDLPDSIGP